MDHINKKKATLMRKNSSGFTLIEILVATLASTVVIGGAVALFLTALDTWTAGAADIRLERCASLALEKIARGPGGRYGLREAKSSSVVVGTSPKSITFVVDKNSTPTTGTDDDTTVMIYLDADSGRLMYDPDTSVSGNQFELSLEGVVENIDFTLTGNVLTVELFLSEDVTTSSRNMAMKFKTSVYIRKG